MDRAQKAFVLQAQEKVEEKGWKICGKIEINPNRGPALTPPFLSPKWRACFLEILVFFFKNPVFG